VSTSIRTYSTEKSAEQKRRYRQDPEVKRKEAARNLAAYAAKKGSDAHNKKLAAKRAAYKEKKLVKVKEAMTATTPFASADECEGVYVVETRKEIIEKVLKKHSFRRSKPSEVALAIGKKLANVTYDEENKPVVNRISYL